MTTLLNLLPLVVIIVLLVGLILFIADRCAYDYAKRKHFNPLDLLSVKDRLDLEREKHELKIKMRIDEERKVDARIRSLIEQDKLKKIIDGESLLIKLIGEAKNKGYFEKEFIPLIQYSAFYNDSPNKYKVGIKKNKFNGLSNKIIFENGILYIPSEEEEECTIITTSEYFSTTRSHYWMSSIYQDEKWAEII